MVQRRKSRSAAQTGHLTQAPPKPTIQSFQPTCSLKLKATLGPSVIKAHDLKSSLSLEKTPVSITSLPHVPNINYPDCPQIPLTQGILNGSNHSMHTETNFVSSSIPTCPINLDMHNKIISLPFSTLLLLFPFQLLLSLRTLTSMTVMEEPDLNPISL